MEALAKIREHFTALPAHSVAGLLSSIQAVDQQLSILQNRQAEILQKQLSGNLNAELEKEVEYLESQIKKLSSEKQSLETHLKSLQHSTPLSAASSPRLSESHHQSSLSLLPTYSIGTEQYYEIDVPSDGTCLFYSVMFSVLLPALNNPELFHQQFIILFGEEVAGSEEAIKELLRRYNGSIQFVKDHPELEVLVDVQFRQRLIIFMSKPTQRTQLEPYIPENQTFDTRMAETKLPKRWGDEPEIKGINLFLNKRIEVYQQGQSGEPQVYEEQGDSAAIRLVFTGKISGSNNHYHFLIHKEYLGSSNLLSVPSGTSKTSVDTLHIDKRIQTTLYSNTGTVPAIPHSLAMLTKQRFFKPAPLLTGTQIQVREMSVREDITAVVAVEQERTPMHEANQYLASPIFQHINAEIAVLQMPPSTVAPNEGENLITPIFNIPDYTPLFNESRLLHLEQIATYAQQDIVDNQLHLITIKGIKGIGKSQLARKYIHQHRHEFKGACWWVDASSERTLLNSFQTLAQKIGISETNKNLMVNAVYQKLDSLGRNLIIFDNLHTAHFVITYLPPTKVNRQKFLLIITTINQTLFDEYPSVAMRCQDAIMQKDAEDYIEKNLSPNKGTSREKKKLIKLLGYHPLAICHAVGYISQTPSLTVKEYISLFNRERTALLKKKVKEEEGCESVYVTFSLSLKAIEENKVAIDIMNMCAYLHAHHIDRRGVARYCASQSTLHFNDAMRLLHSFSLIEDNKNPHCFDVHTLTQLITRILLEERDPNFMESIIGYCLQFFHKVEPQGLSQALSMVNDDFNYNHNDGEIIKQLGLLLPHAIMVIGHAEKLKYQSSRLAHLVHSVGVFYLDVEYNIKKAKRYLEKADAINKHLKLSPKLKALTLRQLHKAYLRNAVTAKTNSDKDKYFAISERYLFEAEELKYFDEFMLCCDIANLYLRKIEYFDNELIDQHLEPIEESMLTEEESLDEALTKTPESRAKLPDKTKTRFQLTHFVRYSLEKAERLINDRESHNQAMLLHYWGSYYIKISRYPEARLHFKKALLLKKTLLQSNREMARSNVELAHACIEKSWYKLRTTSYGGSNQNLINAQLFLREALTLLFQLYTTSINVEIAEVLDKLAVIYHCQHTEKSIELAIHCRVAIVNILRALKRSNLENERDLIMLFKKLGNFVEANNFVKSISDESHRKILSKDIQELNGVQHIQKFATKKPFEQNYYLTEDCSINYLCTVLKLNTIGGEIEDNDIFNTDEESITSEKKSPEKRAQDKDESTTPKKKKKKQSRLDEFFKTTESAEAEVRRTETEALDESDAELTGEKHNQAYRYV